MVEIYTGQAARRLMASSLVSALRAIAASLGPHGRACLVDGGPGPVEQALTGAAIARAIAGESGPRSVAQRILKDTLFDAERDLGDGTARLAVIFGHILTQGVRFIAAGVPAGQLADALLALMPEIDEQLARERVPDAPLARVAATAGASTALAEAVAEAIERVGPEGTLEITTGSRPGIATRVGSGFIADATLVSEAFLQGAPAAGLVFDPVHVLVADEIIEDFGPLVPVLEGFATRGKALVVVARAVTGAALAALLRNRQENGLRVVALKPREVAQHAADVLEDLALATGATLVADRFGTSVAALRPAMLGRAGSFRFHRARAVFAEPAGEAVAVAARARLLAAEADRQRYLALDRERLLRRSARLTGRWGEIEVTGAHERDGARLLTAARAALAAAQSAGAGGALPGGGAGLGRAARRLAEQHRHPPLSARGAATACILSGLCAVELQLLRNCDEGFRQIAQDGTLLDPLPLTQALVSRAISSAATMLRADAIICS
ncbi:TCP-1/cpn60 chaperonin family protein [Chelatococcus sp. GCM10030263]|uniref:TCP-1/cpn60 chaperonin family protein n=1 Tax=Chelatococcus sp. GCM10030263 TaxID=3273387 RepID=UPI00361933E1